MAALWKRRSVLKSCAISRTRRWNGNFLINNSVDFWYRLISRRATVPGLQEDKYCTYYVYHFTSKRGNLPPRQSMAIAHSLQYFISYHCNMNTANDTVPWVKRMAIKNSAVTDFWFNLAHIQTKCCKHIYSINVPKYSTNFTYTLTFSNTATRNITQTQLKVLLFQWPARFTILNILPSMAHTTMPKKVTIGNTWVQQLHLLVISTCIVCLALF